MSINKFNPRTITLLIFIVLVGAIRTYLSFDENMFGLSNFSPVGAMALFGGVYFNKRWKAFFFPILTLLVSDLILHSTIFKSGSGFLYKSWYYIYGAIILMVIVGCLIKKVSVKNIFLGSVITVLIHWLITDLGVWYQSKTYSQDIEGYWRCLVMAIPFEGRFLTGTLLYSGILFGLFEWLQDKYPALSRNKTAHP